MAGYAFLCYAREDSDRVDSLAKALRAAGVRVWQDTEELSPGQDRRIEVRRAITNGALVFLACFSAAGLTHAVSSQNDELAMAAEQARLRPADASWLIPVRFDDCVVPDLDLGGGRTLIGIQQADLFGPEAGAATERLAATVARLLGAAGPRPAGAAVVAGKTAGPARSGTLVLAVHAIDRRPAATPPDVEIDLVDLYDDDTDPFARLQLRDPADWNAKVEPAIRRAARDLEAYSTRRVHVTGDMRLPLWFAIGRALPDVRGWVLSADQRTEEWSTGAMPEAVTARVLAETRIGSGPDLAVAVCVTHDISADVAGYITGTGVPADLLLALGPPGEPNGRAASSAGWTIAWVGSARERARRAAAACGAKRIHLYLAAPAALAMMLGHQWNLMPPTIVYEYLQPGYAPTITCP